MKQNELGSSARESESLVGVSKCMEQDPEAEKLQAFMRGEKKSLPMSKDFADFKRYLMNI